MVLGATGAAVATYAGLAIAAGSATYGAVEQRQAMKQARDAQKGLPGAAAPNNAGISEQQAVTASQQRDTQAGSFAGANDQNAQKKSLLGT